MLMATDILSAEERAATLALAPWRVKVRKLTGLIRGALANQAVDMIDAALGPNHARAALVALYEGMDLLLEATIDLVNSLASEKLFERIVPMDPLGEERLSNPEEIKRIPFRFARYAVEDAATRSVTASDHLANAHGRLAWEANAATLEEMLACTFDPREDEPKSWITAVALKKGLEEADRKPLGVFSSFAPNGAFRAYMSEPAVSELRRYRHAVIHRARPSYRETPAFGRTTLWTQPSFTIRFPPPKPGEESPSLSDYREMVGQAISSTVAYAVELWEFSVRWLRSVDIWINASEGEVAVRTTYTDRLRFPREHRDPGPFLNSRFGEQDPR